MRYTIMGFSQKKAVELKLTPKELVFLRWFIDFMVTMKMKSIIIEEITYFWIDNKTVIEELPMLNITLNRDLRRFLKGLVNKKVLKYFLHRGNAPYYTTNHETMSELLSFPLKPRRPGGRGARPKARGGSPKSEGSY